MHVYKKNKAVMTNRIIFREFSSSIIYNSFLRLASKIYFTKHIKMKDEEVNFPDAIEDSYCHNLPPAQFSLLPIAQDLHR